MGGRLFRIAAAVAVLAATPAAAAGITWPVENYDPAAKGATPAPADLVLPMPCGGAMAFQKVTVSVDANDPLDDRRIRVGQSQSETGFADYLHSEYLRGPFTDAAAGETYYYLARYELTAAQYRALSGTCAEPSRADRLAQGGLGWFDAVNLSRTYSEWLLANARDRLPKQEDGVAYLRLPTEAEWEYAARGGAKIDSAQFPARRFFGDGDLRDYAIFQAAGSGRGKVGPIGLRKPNQLGLFDIYGNAEELMLEPFRLNAVGRLHGQVGGLVTRGGSVLSTTETIYSAQRAEYPMFSSVDGKALTSDTFGVRMVLTTQIATSDARLRQIRDRWLAVSDAPAGSGDPLANLAALIEEEADPRRQNALSELQLEFRTAKSAAEAALQEAAKSALLSGAVFVGALESGAEAIKLEESGIRYLIDRKRLATGQEAENYMKSAREKGIKLEELRRSERTYLLSFRSALETLTQEISPDRRDSVYRLLAEELTLAGQDKILGTLRRFWNDLAAYGKRPDMSESDLRKLALTP